MKTKIDLGILYSRSGTYSALSEAQYRGAMRAINEINASDAFTVEFRPITRDPKGQLDQYAPLSAEILQSSDAEHIIGCVTSSSRKEVIPVLDRTGAMLWYNTPYEGFETSNRVIYSHTCANQNVLPLMRWCFRNIGLNAYLTGSNYIWGWETCRVARGCMDEAGGKVLGERFLPLDDEDITALIADIETARPEFIFNSLVGASSYAFIKAYQALGLRDPYFTAENCPIVSCNLTECELPMLGTAAEGLISVGPYFCKDHSTAGHGSSLEVTAYRSVFTLADVLMRKGNMPFDGYVADHGAHHGIDPDTFHRTLDVNVAQIRDGRFEVVCEWSGIAPDPYLTRPARHPMVETPKLKVVS